MSSKALFDKIWDSHVMSKIENDPHVLHRYFVPEVRSLQAFNGLKTRNIPVFYTGQIIAMANQNVFIKDQRFPIKNQLTSMQGKEAEEAFEISLFSKKGWSMILSLMKTEKARLTAGICKKMANIVFAKAGVPASN